MPSAFLDIVSLDADNAVQSNEEIRARHTSASAEHGAGAESQFRGPIHRGLSPQGEQLTPRCSRWVPRREVWLVGVLRWLSFHNNSRFVIDCAAGGVGRDWAVLLTF